MGAVTGEGASWDVPVHVIGANAALRERLVAAGFRQGIEPKHPTLGGMHELTPLLLKAFDGHGMTTAAHAAGWAPGARCAGPAQASPRRQQQAAIGK